MSQTVAQNYLRTKVLTATPEQLQLMLYDGAIAFAEQSKTSLINKNFEASFTQITKAQKIIAELLSSLKPEIAPDICKQLVQLYTYVYRRLIEANTDHSIEAVDDALKILSYQRETWALLLAQLGKQKAAVAAKSLDLPAPSDRMEATISMQG